MTYEEKGAWNYLVVSLGTYAGYLVIILQRARSVPFTEMPYVSTMLWTIGIAIGLSIAGRIAIEIARPSENYKSDARDKEINRFGEYVGGLVLGIGMVLPLALTLAEADHFWIANAIYAIFVLAALVSTTVKLVAYRRGL